MELNEAYGEEPTELCELAYKYGTDKCSQIAHAYTPIYYELLKDRRKSVRKVLEIGVGNSACMKHVARLKGAYLRGASLYMWREFFPKAQIYGADIDPRVIFEETRIKTFLCDQSKEEDLTRLVEATGGDIDLVVDDGTHRREHQIATCLALMPLLKKDVIYAIEDVISSRVLVGALRQYQCWVPPLSRKCRNYQLVVIKNKS